MKTEMEIARAHDILCAVKLNEIPVRPGAPEDEARMTAALDALCWVLEHREADCGNVFSQHLAAIEREAAARGFVLTRRNT